MDVRTDGCGVIAIPHPEYTPGGGEYTPGGGEYTLRLNMNASNVI